VIAAVAFPAEKHMTQKQWSAVDAYIVERLVRPNTVLIAALAAGEILDASGADASVQGTRRFFDLLASGPRPSATGIQTVGDKVWDGFTLAIVD
jgi:predicted O-methyltransferase YrrM